MEIQRLRFFTAVWLLALVSLCTPVLQAQTLSNSYNDSAGSGNPRLVAVAKKYVGVRELGKNSGYYINRWQRDFGGRNGEPYCAYFVSAMLDESGAKFPKVRSGLAQKFFIKASVRIDYVAKGYTKVQPGWLLIWGRFKNGKNTGQGHIGINENQYKNGKIIEFLTIEANTRDGSNGNQRDGDGVYQRKRRITKGDFRLIAVTPTW